MIRSRSTKRAAQERQYSKLRKVYLFTHPECEVHWGIWAVLDDLSPPTPNSEEIHHKKGRVGDLLTDERYFLAVCRQCHQWIELHPAEAKERGYSLSRLS